MSAHASSSRNTQVNKTNKSTVKDPQAAAKQSTTNTAGVAHMLMTVCAAIVQCWMPSYARCHYDEENNLVQVTCRCQTCRSKSVGGVELAFATVEYWLAGHNLNAWKDPLGSGFHVVAIKSCTEKFLEKVHPEEYAKGVRFWMNFEKNRFDVLPRSRQQKASASEQSASNRSAPEASESAPAESLATAPKPQRPMIPPAPAVNPWSKGKQEHTQEHKADPDATAELKKPLPKKEKKHFGTENGEWKKVDTELTPDSRHVVIKTESSQQPSATGACTAPFDLRLEKLCKFGKDCRYNTYTETRKFVCPYNHHTTATIIAKGERIPDSHCPYDNVTFADGKVKVVKCKNKACRNDHLEHHVAYCKGFAGASNAPQPVQQAVHVIYVLPNGHTMMGPPMVGPPMVGPPMMPQFAPPRFHGKPQNKRRPPHPNYVPPKPKQELTDAEFEASLETEQVDSKQEDAELSAIDEEKKAQKLAWLMDPDTDWNDIKMVCCRGQKCGHMTPEYCECPLPSDFEESESEDEDAILSRATAVASAQ